MTTNSYRGPAKIYDFPARGRFAERGQSEESKSAANPAVQGNFLAPGAAKVVFGSSWYHEEAIREERTRTS